MTVRDYEQRRIHPDLGFTVVPRTDAGRTRPALERACWFCEACRSDDGLRVCVDRKDRFVVLCVLCRATPDEFKRVVLRRTYSFKPVPKGKGCP